MQKGKQRLKEANVRNISLTDFDTTVNTAAQQGLISPESVQRLFRFRDNPSDESWIKE